MDYNRGLFRYLMTSPIKLMLDSLCFILLCDNSIVESLNINIGGSFNATCNTNFILLNWEYNENNKKQCRSFCGMVFVYLMMMSK